MRWKPSRLSFSIDSVKDMIDPADAAKTRTNDRRNRRSVTKRSLLYKRPGIVIVVAILLLVLLWAGLRVYKAQSSYQEASEQVDVLQTITTENVATLSAEDMARIEERLDTLRLQLRQLNNATSLPLGADSIVSYFPWLGPRYDAARDMLQIGLTLADAGASSAQIGRELLFALKESGIGSGPPSSSPTWLDVLANHETQIQRIVGQVEHAQNIRAGVDADLLPAGARAQLDTLDRAMSQFPIDLLAEVDLQAIQAGLGAEETVRYLLLFQNPAELRPGGGFPGTIALVTVERGQLKSYEFSNVRKLTNDYIEQRERKVPQPWPIQQYFPQNGFLLHDATWFADFPKSGKQVMSMYAETDWPPIHGVIAIQPAAISRILSVIGPITVTIDDEQRRITAENFYEEIERQRRRRRQGIDVETTHKEAVGLISKAILARLESANRQALVQILKQLADAADHRDVQFYVANPEVQAALAERHWTGRLIPDPDTPTLAVTFANVAINKASLAMQPHMSLTFEGGENDRRNVRLRLDLEHTGSNEVDPLYGGFQRWWIEVKLPKGSSLLTTNPDSSPNPESPNGGSYLIEIFPGQTGHLELTFTMPDQDKLLVRRQPGLTPIELSVDNARCERPTQKQLEADITFDLTKLCH